MIVLELISENNANDIYNFEKKNRIYFEKTLQSRGDEYYEIELFKKIISELVYEQNSGKCLMFIIRDESGDIVGRINLTSIKCEEMKVAELGYRIGESEKGKGYATEATRQILKIGSEQYGIEKVKAGTDIKNYASQSVLKTNGFILVGEVKRDIKINGKWVDSFIFEKFIDGDN